MDKDTDVDGFNPGAVFPLVGIVQQDDYLRPFTAGYNVAPRSREDVGGSAATATLMSIAAAKVDEIDNESGTPGADFIPDFIGQLVRVRGTVTPIDFQSTASTEYFIQDATGGIDVFASQIALGPFSIGDSIDVAELVTQFSGLTEISVSSAANATLLAAGSTPAITPQVVTIAQLINPATAENLEGRLVRLDNVTVDGSTFPSNNNLTITDATGSMLLRVDADTDIDGTATPSGPLSVTAVASQFAAAPFDSGYQILPRFRADIVGVTPALTSSPGTMAFGPVILGATAPDTVTITNTGTATITLTPPFAITGTNANQFSAGAPGMMSLAVGASTAVSVSFAPTSAGPKAATLNISSTTTTAIVALTGTGQVAGLTTPLVISEFRTRGLNGASDEFVEIYNNTGAPIDLGGYRLQASNASGTLSTRATVPAGRSIPARGHYLFTNPTASGWPYSGSVTGDQTFTTGITDDGGIALMVPAPGTTLVDQVGMSSGSAYKEGATLAPLTTTAVNRSYERRLGGSLGSQVDTNVNSADFQLLQPSLPQNTASAPTPASVSCPAITVTGSLPAGAVSAAYSAPLSATGGTPPYAFSLASGTLSAGLLIQSTSSTTASVQGTPAAAGIFNVSVQAIDVNACPGAAPYSVAIAGVATLTAAPSPLDFGPVGVNGSHMQFVTVTNTSSFAVTLTPPFAAGGANAAECAAGSSSATLNAGASTKVPVTFLPTTTAPVEIGNYELRGSNGAGLTTVRATVPAGRTIPAYGHYLFTNAASGGYSGSVTGGQTYTTGVTDDGGVAIVRADGTIIDAAGFSAGSAFTEGTPLASLASSSAGRGYERLLGGFAGSRVDTDRNASDFILRAPSAPENGASPSTPSIALSPASIDFGAVHAGNSAGAVVTVTNVGGSVVTLSPPTASGAGGIFSPGVLTATTLAAGETADVPVGFNPLTLGPTSATLSVTTTSGETRTVALSGTGVCPAVALSGPLPNGMVNAAYSGVLFGSGGVAPYSFAGDADLDCCGAPRLRHPAWRRTTRCVDDDRGHVCLYPAGRYPPRRGNRAVVVGGRHARRCRELPIGSRQRDDRRDPGVVDRCRGQFEP